jgi:ectoine hydroxylase-related dioxygenase (phytanoyl-CoA dioxygenase family)
MKPPLVGAAQGWHQDSASWRDIFPMDLVSAWTAIDEAGHDNGCLQFVPGTHRWGMLRGERLQAFAADLGHDPWPAVPVPLRPGCVSFHHSLTIHRSGANTSGRRRRGYAVHYMRATSWQDESVTDAPKVPPFRQVRGRSLDGRV